MLWLVGFVLSLSLVSRAQDGFAVVELFTSQGCSSCPAADKNLSELLSTNKNIYGLSFHVDYWNYIGWKDPYSSKSFSERQRNYDKALASNVYTPQMIVNGTHVFVGSNKSISNQSVKAALAVKSKYSIEINKLVVADNKVLFDYQVSALAKEALLNVALVERNVENFVSKGENQGKTLHHDNVVRAFETLPLKLSGHLQIDLKDGVPENCSVILFVQDKNLHVVAADRQSMLVKN